MLSQPISPSRMMDHFFLSLFPGLMDEAYRIAVTLWVMPWMRDTFQKCGQLFAIRNGL
jgi:hypothetical protein